MCLRVGSPVAVTRCVYVVIPQGLSPFSRNMAIRWLHRMSDAPQEEFQRARGWLVNLMNGAAGRVINDWQHGCPEIVPLLRAIPFWQPGTFPWAAHITSQFDAIKAEMLALRGRGASARGGCACVRVVLPAFALLSVWTGELTAWHRGSCATRRVPAVSCAPVVAKRRRRCRCR